MRIFGTTSGGTKYIDSEFLLNAYCQGLFPMADGKEGEIHWFSPDRRGIIPLDGLIVSRSLRQSIRKRTFELRINTAFESVIRACGAREDVWISETIVQSYLRLHVMGFAHSVECWSKDELAGGLYGVAINGAFFGESMFSRRTDASKVALVHLVERLRTRGYLLLDTQFVTPHLATLGCREISKQEYHIRLNTALQKECTFI
ncbi:MAG: leucyl/phenylalanyl-tRNA--protein transferase [Bacteroidota bacterium]